MRSPISRKVRIKILNRDNYTCKICGYNKMFTIADVPKQYLQDFKDFAFYKCTVVNSRENRILEYVDVGGDIKDITFKWLSPVNLEIDHIIPVCFGGTDDESNLQTLCIRCHVEKSYYDGS